MAGNTLDGTGRCLLSEEMVAFDRLGPLSRTALREARYQIGALSLVRAFVVAGAELDDPRVDRAGARCVRDLDAKLAFKFSLHRDAA